MTEIITVSAAELRSVSMSVSLDMRCQLAVRTVGVEEPRADTPTHTTLTAGALAATHTTLTRAQTFSLSAVKYADELRWCDPAEAVHTRSDGVRKRAGERVGLGCCWLVREPA